MLVHKHLIVNATVDTPPRAGDEVSVINWLKKLVDVVGMKIVIGPHAHYCTADDNEGMTAACCIETSHVSMHVWDKTDPPLFRFDLYSCAEFDVEDVLSLIEEFKPDKLDWLLLDRNENVQVVDGRNNNNHP